MQRRLHTIITQVHIGPRRHQSFELRLFSKSQSHLQRRYTVLVFRIDVRPRRKQRSNGFDVSKACRQMQRGLRGTVAHIDINSGGYNFLNCRHNTKLRHPVKGRQHIAWVISCLLTLRTSCQPQNTRQNNGHCENMLLHDRCLISCGDGNADCQVLNPYNTRRA